MSRGSNSVWRFLAIVALGLSATLHAGAPDESIEDFIDREMPGSGVPGLAYAVVADGEITSVGAHGVVKVGGDDKVTPDTPFLTGSISKSFTALAVMQLVEAGEIELDTEVSRYLDSFSGRPRSVPKLSRPLRQRIRSRSDPLAGAARVESKHTG